MLYDVVIYEIATRRIDAVIGVDMRGWDGNGSGRGTAELRQQTGRERVNDRYEVAIVPAKDFRTAYLRVGEVLPEGVEVQTELQRNVDA